MDIDTIKKLTSEWIKEEAGSKIINVKPSNLLIDNGLVVEDLVFDDLLDMGICILPALYKKGGITVVLNEHRKFIAWCANLIMASKIQVVHTPRSLLSTKRKLFQQATMFALAKYQSTSNSIFDTILINSTHTLGYLSYPLLECILKDKCSDYVSEKGIVVKEFEIPQIADSKGNPKKLQPGNIISSIKVLLYLFLNNVASNKQIRYVEIVLSQLAAVDPEIDVPSLIQNWRNSSLHGAWNEASIGYYLLFLTYFIEMVELEDRFEEIKVEVFNRIKIKGSAGSSGYPLEWYEYPL